jgi:spermidine/putrescine-binding protein
MRKIIIALIAIVFVMSNLIAQDKVLRIIAPPWVFLKTPLEECAKKFEADHKGVKVELTRIDKWAVPAFIAEWQTGKSSFDLNLSGTGSMLAPVIVGDWVIPLDDILTGNTAADKYVKSFLAEGKYKDKSGKAYYPVIPFVGESSMIGVNTEVFKKSGLWKDDKPVGIPSFDEKAFFAYFAKIKPNAGAGVFIFPWDKEFMQYDYAGPLLAMQGTFESKDGKGWDVTSANAKKWLGMLQRLNKDGLGAYTITIDTGLEKWKTGAAGLIYAAQGHAQELAKLPNKKESDIAYIGWPGADKNGSIIWTHSAFIPKTATEKDLAKAFIKEQVLSIYWQQWTWNKYGKLPALKAAYTGLTAYKDQIPTILKIVEASKSIPLYKDLQAYLDIVNKYIPEAAYGRMGVDEALKHIKDESKALDFSDIRAK